MLPRNVLTTKQLGQGPAERKDRRWRGTTRPFGIGKRVYVQEHFATNEILHAFAAYLTTKIGRQTNNKTWLWRHTMWRMTRCVLDAVRLSSDRCYYHVTPDQARRSSLYDALRHHCLYHVGGRASRAWMTYPDTFCDERLVYYMTYTRYATDAEKSVVNTMVRRIVADSVPCR